MHMQLPTLLERGIGGGAGGALHKNPLVIGACREVFGGHCDGEETKSFGYENRLRRLR
jgi:hypothetical protein